MHTSDDLDHARSTAAAIAVLAGDRALDWFRRSVTIEEKGARDLVSEADRDVEQLIATQLGDAFPDDAIVGEEGAGADGHALEGRRRWYIDPIDGTTNFLKGLPGWGVSLGLAGPDDELLVGVIAMPAMGGIYTAAIGRGATRDGQALQASRESRIDRTLMAYAHSRGDNPWGDRAARRTPTDRLVEQTLGTRLNGCATVDFTLLASGRLDGYWAGGMGPWDVAAGLVLIREAGLTVTGVDGTAVTTVQTSFLASAPAVHEQLQSLIGRS